MKLNGYILALPLRETPSVLCRQVGWQGGRGGRKDAHYLLREDMTNHMSLWIEDEATQQKD